MTIYKSSHSRIPRFVTAWLCPVAIVIAVAARLDLPRQWNHGYQRINPNEQICDGYGDAATHFSKDGQLAVDFFRTPVVPLFFLVVHQLTGGFHWIRFIHVVLSCLASLMLFRCLKVPLGSVPACLTSILFSLSLSKVLAFPMSEGLTFFLGVGLIYFLLRHHSTGRHQYFWATALTTSLVALARPSLGFLVPVIGSWVLVQGFRLRGRLHFRIVHLVVGLGFLFAPLLAWMSYNKFRGGAFTLSHMVWGGAGSHVAPYLSPMAKAPELDPDAVALNQGLKKLSASLDTWTVPTASWLTARFESPFFKNLPPSCLSHRKILSCLNGDKELWQYHDHLSDVFLHHHFHGIVREVSKDGHARLAEELGKLVLIDVLRNRPAAFAKITILNLEHLFLGAVRRPRQLPFWTFLVPFCCGLFFCLRLLIRISTGKELSELDLLGAYGFIFHLSYMATIAVFGTAGVPRYVEFSWPLFLIPPLLLGSGLLAMVWAACSRWCRRMLAGPSIAWPEDGPKKIGSSPLVVEGGGS